MNMEERKISKLMQNFLIYAYNDCIIWVVTPLLEYFDLLLEEDMGQ